MSWERIRPVALGAVRHDGRLLVDEAVDPATGDQFYRLPGGGVEFGEHSRETVVREFREELDVTFEIDDHVGTFERVFEFAGETGHEIWRVYAGEIDEDWPYEREAIDYREPEIDERLTARWMPLERLREPSTTFYAPVVLDALEEE